MIKRLILKLIKKYLTKESLELLINELADLLADKSIEALQDAFVYVANKLADHKDSKFTRDLAENIEQAFKTH